MFWNISGKAFLIFAVLAFLGLMMAIDGVLNGPWYRFLGGLAWFVAWGWLALFGPPKPVGDRVDAFQDQVFSQAAAVRRQDGSRLPIASLFLVATYAASKTAWERFKA